MAHLDSPHDLELCRRAEVHPLSKDQDEAMTKTIVILHLFPEEEPEISGDVPAGHVHPHDAVGHREALVDGHGVRHPVTGVQHYASGAACRGVSCSPSPCSPSPCSPAPSPFPCSPSPSPCSTPPPSFTCSVKTQHRLQGDEKRGDVESLEEDLCRLFPVSPGIEGSLRQEDRVLLGERL